MACVLSWTGNWSPQQRQRFLSTVAQLDSGPSEEDLLFGMSGLGLQQGKLSEISEQDCLSNIVLLLKVRVQICSSVSLNCSQDGGKIGVKRKDRRFETNAGPHHDFTLSSKNNC